MAKPSLLITRRTFDPVIEALQEHFELVYNEHDALWTPQQIVERARSCDAILVVASDKIDEGFLNACAQLKIVASGSVGTNHIDLKACAARQVQVSNTPDVLSEATADMAWALLMAAARRVTESEAWLRSGQWKRWAWDQFLGCDVYGARLGIVGMGRIGSAIARRARGFNMDIVYTNRSESAQAAELGARRLALPELLAQSDFVMLVLPYSSESHHLIGAAQLAQMKPSAVLINIARGGIVDDQALATALKQGTIAGAGLDVFEGEPALFAGLLEAPGVVLTPHIGSATSSARLGMAMLAARNLIAWAQGKPLITPVALP